MKNMQLIMDRLKLVQSSPNYKYKLDLKLTVDNTSAEMFIDYNAHYWVVKEDADGLHISFHSSYDENMQRPLFKAASIKEGEELHAFYYFIMAIIREDYDEDVEEPETPEYDAFNLEWADNWCCYMEPVGSLFTGSDFNDWSIQQPEWYVDYTGVEPKSDPSVN